MEYVPMGIYGALLLALGAICGAALVRKQTNAHSNSPYTATLESLGRSLRLRLLHDSGNLLKTYRGDSVIVIKEEFFAYLFGISKARFNELPDAISAMSELPENELSQTLLLAASTIDGTTILLLRRADSLTIPQLSVDAKTVYVASGAISSDAFDGIANFDMLK